MLWPFADISKPDLFFTMAANPKWPEILHSLFPGQTVKTLNLTVEYVFQLEALYLTLDIFMLLTRGSG